MGNKKKNNPFNIQVGVEMKRCATCQNTAKANDAAAKKNYICIEGNHIPMSAGLVAAYKRMLGICVKLADIPEGETFKIGDYNFIVLQQTANGTAVILKDLLPDTVRFGNNNNYDGSNIDEECQAFAQKLADIIGWDNITLHKVDLTSDDGLKDYGVIERRVSSITTEIYRKYVELLDKYKPDEWWWLATPFSTERHNNTSWVKCVSPSGSFSINYFNGGNGVRPFCILKSNIFVSK